MTTAAIETDRLTKRFRLLGSYRDLVLYPWRRPSTLAVDEVSLRIDQGELFGLLGENGAGKTTLIRMLSTTLLPTTGRALVGGHDAVREPQAVRRMIGLVTGDERSFYWRLTGRQNLAYFAALYHLAPARARSRVDELLETLGVSQYADVPFNAYSSGTRQRFAIARGLLTDPRILFLDEPTRSLDPTAADELRSYVREQLVERLGHTVLLATHSLSEAEAICDRLAIVRHGRLVALGTVPALRRRVGLSSVLELDLTNVDDGLAERLRSVEGVRAVTVDGRAGAARIAVDHDAGDGVVDALLHAVIGCGATIRGVTTREPALPEIYRAIHDGSLAAQEETA